VAWAEEGMEKLRFFFFFFQLDVRKKKGRGEEALFDFKFDHLNF
jgi:hypothetical protein